MVVFTQAVEYPNGFNRLMYSWCEFKRTGSWPSTVNNTVTVKDLENHISNCGNEALDALNKSSSNISSNSSNFFSEGNDPEIIKAASEAIKDTDLNVVVCRSINLKNNLETFKPSENPLSKSLKDQVAENINKLNDVTDSLIKLLEESYKGKGGNNFFPGIDKFFPGIDNFYNYLDSLTLLQESSLLHIIVLINLMVLVLHNLFIFFGNEIIKYLDLENKYPKLATFLKLRAKFQRYYLMWNIFLMFFICVAMICIDLLVLIKT